MSGHGSPLPFFDKIEELLGETHEGGGVLLPGTGIMIAGGAALFAFFTIAPYQTITNFQFLLFFSPLWIPVVLGRFTLLRFIQARRAAFINSEPTVLLELRLPRDTAKTPQAMETVFSSLALASGEATWFKRYFLGRCRPWWSFELVSLGGRVYFYVWTRVKMRRLLESYFYAQYPGMEIVEATDYSRLIDPTHPPFKMWAAEYFFTRPDPYPIKTYIDFVEPNKPPPKPEEQVDPLSQVIEILGSVGPHEQVWVQIIFRATKYEKYGDRKNSKGRRYTWKDEAMELVEKMRKEATTTTEYVDKTTGEIRSAQGFPNPTKGQADEMAAIERNVSKLGFDVGIRTIYSAREDSYHKGMGSALANLWKPFSSERYNGLRPGRWSESYNDYPWEDPSGHHLEHAMHEVLEMFRRRSFFHPPYRGNWMIMSTEELATLFHIPSSTVATPTLPRIQSSTSEAPHNLPT